MKVSINENGILVIKAANDQDRFALKLWCANNINLIDSNVDLEVKVNNDDIYIPNKTESKEQN